MLNKLNYFLIILSIFVVHNEELLVQPYFPWYKFNHWKTRKRSYKIFSVQRMNKANLLQKNSKEQFWSNSSAKWQEVSLFVSLQAIREATLDTDGRLEEKGRNIEMKHLFSQMDTMHNCCPCKIRGAPMGKVGLLVYWEANLLSWQL